MRDIGTAIQFLHSQNIAHRDVKVSCQNSAWGTAKEFPTHGSQHSPN